MVISKWGNSLAVRIPKQIAIEAGIEEGSEVELKASKHAIVITRRARGGKRRYSLDELIDGITAENLHSTIEWGKPLGKEVW